MICCAFFWEALESSKSPKSSKSPQISYLILICFDIKYVKILAKPVKDYDNLKKKVLPVRPATRAAHGWTSFDRRLQKEKF